MKYSKTRKINLGRYGYQFESVDLCVEGCDSKEQADKEIEQWAREEVKKYIKTEDTVSGNTISYYGTPEALKSQVKSVEIEPDIEVKEEDIPF